MRKIKMNLRMFDGEGAPAAAQVPGVNGQDAAVHKAETRPASEETTPDLNARFEEMINGEYREIYNERMQTMIRDRLQKTNARHAKEQGDLQDKSNRILNLIGSKYGILDGDLDKLQKEVENDKTYWEDAAAKEGMSVDQYMYMKKIEQENANFKKAQEDAARIQQKNRILANWNAEAEELKKIYKDFDIQKEAQNPDFTRLLASNVNMRTAYEVLHHDDIIGGAMAYTAQTVAKKQIDAIKSGQSHPVEGAAKTAQAVKTSKDISKMSLQELKEQAKRARNGENITFRED